jgi:hypothetical protein
MGGIFGGGSASTSRRNELAGIGNLLNTSMFGQYGPAQGDITGAGTGLQNVSNFAQQLLQGGDTQLVAPQVSQIQQQAGQQRATSAQFGTRSGGTAAANQMIDTNTNQQINNLMAALTGTGLQAELAANQALGNLGLGSQAIATTAATNVANISSRDYWNAKGQQNANLGALINLGIQGAAAGTSGQLGDILAGIAAA